MTAKKQPSEQPTNQAIPEADQTATKTPQTACQAKPKSTKTQAPKPTVLKLAYDPGNRTLQLWDGTRFQQLPSLFLKLIGSRRPKQIGPDSVLLSLAKDPRNRFTGETYLVGEDCSRYADHKRVFDGNKLENAGLYLAALVAKMYPQLTEATIQLAVNLTEGDIPELANELTKSLKGSFKFIHGDREVNLKVTKVEVHEEGLGAWNQLNQANPQSSKVYRGVINLGGSTLDGILVSSTGLVIEDSAFRSQNGGTVDLAQRIKDVVVYDDPSLTGVNISVFMDRIADGSFEFNGTNFKAVYDEVFPEWFNGGLSSIKQRWQSHYHLIETIIFTGGSSFLIADRVLNNPKFYLAVEPDKVNCKGLL